MTDDQKSQLIRITRKLAEIYNNKEFVLEISKYLSDNSSYMEGIETYLKNEPDLVAADIFRWFKDKTDNNFNYSMNALEIAKNRYIEEKSRDNYQGLLKTIKNNDFIIAFTWDLTEDEEKSLENAEEGDSVRIESPMIPLMLESEDEGGVGIAAFTSDLEISEEYRKTYTFQRCSWSYLSVWIKTLKNAMKRDFFLIVDGLGDAYIELDVKDLLDVN